MSNQKGSGTSDKWIFGCLSLILLILLFLLPAVGYKFNGEDPSKSDYLFGDGPQSLAYPPNTNPDEIKDCLDQAIQALTPGSPLKGIWFAKAGKTNNVNPNLLVAIAKKETNLATSYDYSQPDPNGGQYNVGNIRPTRGSGFANYSSYEEGINALGNLIGNYYIRGNPPLTTVEQIGAEYAPASENDTARWASDVKKYMAEINVKCPQLIPQSNCAKIGKKAAELAKSVVGKPYCRSGEPNPKCAALGYSNIGPESFDCAGLFGWAWWKASGEQWTNMHHSYIPSFTADLNYYPLNSMSDLQPGDILFRGIGGKSNIGNSPTHDYNHAAIYVGNGEVAQAGGGIWDTSTSGPPEKAVRTTNFATGRWLEAKEFARPKNCSEVNNPAVNITGDRNQLINKLKHHPNIRLSQYALEDIARTNDKVIRDVISVADSWAAPNNKTIEIRQFYHSGSSWHDYNRPGNNGQSYAVDLVLPKEDLKNMQKWIFDNRRNLEVRELIGPNDNYQLDDGYKEQQYYDSAHQDHVHLATNY